MRIGLILPEAPQYSETFFNYKIKCLKESGYDVTVFSGKRTKNKLFFKHSSAYPVYKNKKRQSVFHLTENIIHERSYNNTQIRLDTFRICNDVS